MRLMHLIRWLLFFSGCAGQALALTLLCRSGWFSGTADRPRRGPLLLLAYGISAVLFFALWERHFVLALGQVAAAALCLLGGRSSVNHRASGRRAKQP